MLPTLEYSKLGQMKTMLKVPSQIMPFHTLLRDGIQMYIFLWQLKEGSSDVLSSSLHTVNVITKVVLSSSPPTVN